MNTINLAQFCSRGDDNRLFTLAPFLIGEYVYATDAVIAVRIPDTDSMDYEPIDMPPRIEALFGTSVRDSLLPLPTIPPPDECVSCGGTGKVYVCPHCDDGMDGEDDCDVCTGIGTLPTGLPDVQCACYWCQGFGTKKAPLDIGNSQFDVRYLQLIAGLPGALFAPDPINEYGVAYFTFDGGDGMLMPLRK